MLSSLHDLLLLLLLLLRLGAHAQPQFVPGSASFNASLAAAAAAVAAELRSAPLLEEIYYPARYRLPTDYYVASSAGGRYVQNVLFDPCRQYASGCCTDAYGTPEWAAVGAAEGAGESAGSLPARIALRADGSVLPSEASRRPDDEVLPDASCQAAGAPSESCVARGLARAPFRLQPRCWNFNASVVADRSCRAPADGSAVQLCLELAVTQNAMVVECGGAHADNAHCGTYLEVHRPHEAEVLAETRLPGMLTSGYRMTLVSMTHRGAPDRVLCYDPTRRGRYEVWWVQRTLYNFVLERRLPFAVLSPLCDWDAEGDAYRAYATVDPIAGSPRGSSWAEDGLLFAREGVGVDPGRGVVGVGMGDTMAVVGCPAEEY